MKADNRMKEVKDEVALHKEEVKNHLKRLERMKLRAFELGAHEYANYHVSIQLKEGKFNLQV